MNIPLTFFAPHTLRLKPELGELWMRAQGETHAHASEAPAAELHLGLTAAASDAGFTALIGNLPSPELFIGPLPAKALPIVHALAPIAPVPKSASVPVAQGSGLIESTVGAGPI